MIFRRAIKGEGRGSWSRSIAGSVTLIATNEPPTTNKWIVNDCYRGRREVPVLMTNMTKPDIACYRLEHAAAEASRESDQNYSASHLAPCTVEI